MLEQPDAYFEGEILALNYSLVWSLNITQIEQQLLKKVPLRLEQPGLASWKKVTLSVPLFMASHPTALVWWPRGQEEISLEDDIIKQYNRSDSTGLFQFDLCHVKIISDDPCC